VKRIAFRGPEFPVLAALLLKDRSGLSPPWPAAVLCAEATASVVARRIKAWSRGQTKAICVGRPSGDASRFDLVITTAQYRVPAAPNVVEISMPLAGSSAVPAEACSLRHDDLHRPLIALFAGGDAFPDRLDAASAREMLAATIARARNRGGTLAVQTSPRTPPKVIAALRQGISPPHRLHVFGEDENHYRSLLCCADEIVVTSDSVSMVADALGAGKPVSVYPLPRTLSLKYRLAEWLRAEAIGQRRALFAPVRWLFGIGIIEAPADRRALFARLVREGRLGWFGDDPPEPVPDAHHADLIRAAESLRASVTGRR
jgi:uncharacterized protein